MARLNQRNGRGTRSNRRGSPNAWRHWSEDSQVVLWAILVILVIWLASRVWLSIASQTMQEEQALGTSSTLITKSTSTNEDRDTKALPAKASSKLKIVKTLNFRAGPRKESGNILAQLPKDSIVTVIDKEGSWYKVKTSQGEEGYISAAAEFTEQIDN